MTNSFLLWPILQNIVNATGNTPAVVPGASIDPWKLVLDAHWVVQGVMLLLLISSIASWTVIFWKAAFLGSAAKSNKKFNEAFWTAGSMDAAIRASKATPDAGLTRIFEAGLHEFNQISGLKLERQDTLDLIESNVARALAKATRIEADSIQRFNGLLANIASSAPFIGLFGTVWGIMTAFIDINIKGSSSLATVAPGIAEALIATAMGLFAAIPAVLFFNYFVAKGKNFSTMMVGFSSDFLNTAKRSI